jgi:hypothetical protein
MRPVALIIAIATALWGALKLYHAFRNNGDFDAYALGVMFVILGSVLFWKFFPNLNGKRES